MPVQIRNYNTVGTVRDSRKYHITCKKNFAPREEALNVLREATTRLARARFNARERYNAATLLASGTLLASDAMPGRVLERGQGPCSM